MRFEHLPLDGLVLVHSTPRTDERGSFSRLFCAEEFAAAGLVSQFVQDSLAVNLRAHTLRGIHFQKPPSQETKLVQCVRGAIFDVVVDIRPGSASFGKSYSTLLEASEPRALYIPAGFAHGLITLADDTAVHYKITPAYIAGQEGGIRWNDPALGIKWPYPPQVISQRDADLPLLSEIALKGLS